MTSGPRGQMRNPIAKIVGESCLVIAIEPYSDDYKPLVEDMKLDGLNHVSTKYSRGKVVSEE